MAKLSELLDNYDPMAGVSTAPAADTNYFSSINRDEPRPDPSSWANIGMAGVEDKSGKSEHPLVKQLFGLGGEERYQLWPERVVRSGLSAAHNVMSGKTPQWAIDPNTGAVHTSPQMVEKAQEMSALAGSGGLGGADATLGSTPFLRPALKYKDKLYKGKAGQEHQDVIPQHLYSEFQDMAMKGEDISHYNFGFVNNKGHFLDREKALQYGIDNGLIDPQAGKFGALTSTLMADSSKPGVAIESQYKDKYKFTPVEQAPEF